MLDKRLVLAAAVVTAITALPAAAAAQQIAVKGGVNLATLTEADEFPDSSRRLGVVGGVSVRVPAGERFSFLIEGLYSEKGLAFDIEEDGFEASGDIRIRYIEVPLLGRADLSAPGASTRVYVIGGAAPAFKLDARVKAEAEGEEETEDIDDVESVDLGLVGGAGVEFGRFLVEGRYTHGLMSINSDTDEGDDESVRNRVISVMVGYRFR